MDPLPLFQTDFMRWIVILIVIDWTLGVVIALIKGTFKLNLVAHYLHDAVLPYVLVFAVVEIVGQAQPDLYFVVPVSFGLIAITLIGNIVGNLHKVGLPSPKFLRKD